MISQLLLHSVMTVGVSGGQMVASPGVDTTSFPRRVTET